MTVEKPAGAQPSRAPASRDEVRATLSALGFKPRHRFGQNFLISRDVLDAVIVAAGDLRGRTVLEVGPGLGVLTDRLLCAGARVVAAEIDHGLCRHLRSIFGSDAAFELVEGDVLATKASLAEEVLRRLSLGGTAAAGEGFDVVANLPYGITGPFLLALADPPGPPRSAVLMLQREAGDALVAEPGSEPYGLLSVFAATFFQSTRVLRVGPGRFWPEPDVDSVVVRILPVADRPFPARPFTEFLKRLFMARRKALRTTLRGLSGDPVIAERWLAAAQVDPEARVDGVPPSAIARLFAATNTPPLADSGGSAATPGIGPG